MRLDSRQQEVFEVADDAQHEASMCLNDAITTTVIFLHAIGSGGSRKCERVVPFRGAPCGCENVMGHAHFRSREDTYLSHDSASEHIHNNQRAGTNLIARSYN